MAEPPSGAAQGQASFRVTRAKREGANRRQMIGLERVLRPDQKPERKKTFQSSILHKLTVAVVYKSRSHL